ncbi:hypothetical protein [Paracoccus saliphilus]|uniref:Uncharacterized protein n=1 Tax=Paracoccus saliphilus TaxID=405559 RepID=A0AA46A6J5_9RHOB|nr:hypothetical protein [Paracoccus saliphilus]WCR01589.1 hypothetical protein JHX88_11640 [Paracoccus saliphilus]SIS98978.1 hypothetical protein SAMN05421772_11188 [Paracoccus saliphilus]
MQKNTIPFAEIRFPDPDRSRPELEARFTKHFRAMSAERADFDKPMNADGTVNEELWQELLWNIHIPRPALRRIDRRSACLAAREEERSGLGHLKSEDRKRLEALRADQVKSPAICILGECFRSIAGLGILDCTLHMRLKARVMLKAAKITVLR